MVTIERTLPHVKHILSTPYDGYIPIVGPYPGMSDGPFIRPAPTPFPDKFLEVAKYITDSRFVVMQSPAHLVPGGTFLAPHFVPVFNTVFMPVAERFASDELAWHALFHEAAHKLHFERTQSSPELGQWTPYGYWPDRQVTEILADTAAYATMRVLGMNDNAQQVARYRWIFQTPLYTDREAYLTAEIAATLATKASEVLNRV